MPTVTDCKAVALNTKTQLGELLAQADEEVDAINASEHDFLTMRDSLMMRGWKLGGLLVQMKEIVGHGNWEKWLPASMPKLGPAAGTRLNNAKRCMKLFRENQLGASAGKVNFSCDSERKFMWRYIPEKQRPQVKDPRFPRSVSFLNIANEFKRLQHRHVAGIQAVDFDEAREETIDLYEFLKWLHGDSPVDPWRADAR
jgi:hypothetical protein